MWRRGGLMWRMWKQYLILIFHRMMSIMYIESAGPVVQAAQESPSALWWAGKFTSCGIFKDTVRQRLFLRPFPLWMILQRLRQRRFWDWQKSGLRMQTWVGLCGLWRRSFWRKSILLWIWQQPFLE